MKESALKKIHNFKELKISDYKLRALVIMLIYIEIKYAGSDETRFAYKIENIKNDIYPDGVDYGAPRIKIEDSNLKNVAVNMRLKHGVIGVYMNEEFYTILNDDDTYNYIHQNYKKLISKYFVEYKKYIYKLKEVADE